jgi:uncharacterized membrane protein
MWWWNDGAWGSSWMPWGWTMFPWPLVMIIMMVICMGMMFMMHRSHGERSKRTIDMLNESFSRGEITEAQYRNLKQILES